MRDFANWYWTVATSPSQVYSSATNTYVDDDDEAYQDWYVANGNPTPILNEAELWEVITTRLPGKLPEWLFDGTTFVQPAPGEYSKAQLTAYAAAVRYAKETAGIELAGSTIATDRQSQAMINGAYAFVQGQPSATIRWKTLSGFISLSAMDVTAVASAVGAHVQQCFAIEADVFDGIDAEAITTPSEIDAAFA